MSIGWQDNCFTAGFRLIKSAFTVPTGSITTACEKCIGGQIDVVTHQLILDITAFTLPARAITSVRQIAVLRYNDRGATVPLSLETTIAGPT
ncbi:MAG: hypothetical protein CMK05_13725 [Ponticaulis sp.]|nr:hypothetical protein [Ponticaulis sp.]